MDSEGFKCLIILPKYQRAICINIYAYILSTLVTETLRTLGHHMGQKASLYFPLEVSTVGNCSELTGLFSTQHPQQLLGPAPLSWGPELLRVLLGLADLIWVWRTLIRKISQTTFEKRRHRRKMESRIFHLTRLFLVGQAQMMWAATSPTPQKTQILWCNSNLSWTQRPRRLLLW